MREAPRFYPESETYSRQQVQAMTAVPDDVLAFWIKQGLLVAIPSEARAHRRFRYEQLHVAVVLNAMRSLGANVSVLRKFALGLQHGFTLYTKGGFTRSGGYNVASLAKDLNKYRKRQPVRIFDFDDGEYDDRFAKSEEEIIKIWLKDRGREKDSIEYDDKELIKFVIPFAQKLDEYDAKWLGYAIELIHEEILSAGEEYDYIWLAWIDQNSEACIDGAQDANISNDKRPPATFYVSISRLIRPMWRQQANEAEDDRRIRRHNRQIHELQVLERENPAEAERMRRRMDISEDWAETYKIIEIKR